MVKYCSNCGNEMDDDADFCSECGNKIGSGDVVKTRNASTIKIRNFIGENDNITVLDEKGPFKIIEYEEIRTRTGGRQSCREKLFSFLAFFGG